MQNYANLSGQSSVLAYLLGSDNIIVQFKAGQWTFYNYTYASAGLYNIEQMKVLAVQGLGLNSYISTHSPQYARKGSSMSAVSQ